MIVYKSSVQDINESGLTFLDEEFYSEGSREFDCRDDACCKDDVDNYSTDFDETIKDSDVDLDSWGEETIFDEDEDMDVDPMTIPQYRAEVDQYDRDPEEDDAVPDFMGCNDEDGTVKVDVAEAVSFDDIF